MENNYDRKGIMMKKTIFILMVAFVLNTSAKEKFTLKISKEYSPNILKNYGFENLEKKDKPLNWHFDNCSASPDLIPSISSQGAIDKHAALVITKGNLFGYWLQGVDVVEGQTYYASVELKVSETVGLLWIRTGQYHDGKSALHHPKSSTVLFSIANSAHGESLKKVLVDFIDPAYLQGVSPDKWNTYSVEFTVPKGHGIDKYEFRAGAYGGEAGWVMIDNAYLGLAKYKLKLVLTGSELKSIRIVNTKNQEVFAQNLVGNDGEIIFDVELQSRQERYFIEIKDVNGKNYKRNI